MSYKINHENNKLEEFNFNSKESILAFIEESEFLLGQQEFNDQLEMEEQIRENNFIGGYNTLEAELLRKSQQNVSLDDEGIAESIIDRFEELLDEEYN